MKKLLLIVCLFVATTGYSQSNPFQKKFPVIDRYIDSLMKEWNIPGLALCIVYKDQVVYAKGYGYRDIDNKLLVDDHTLFPIASNTKLFTATAACMLAEEKLLSLDQPARHYMPALRFANEELNARVTLRDMLSHRTGLPRYDGIWIASSLTRKETVEKTMRMLPQLGFREGYIYNNMMFAAAGAVLETVTGMRWEELTREKIFAPLHMTTTCFSNEDMIKTGNFAFSYFEPDSTRSLRKVTHVAQSEGLGPAGTIKSNIEDMSHWMIALLNDGRYRNTQVIPAAAIRETLVPANIADKEGKWEELSHSLYGLGRTVQTYKGYKIAGHTGSIDGYYSNLTFIPSEHLAVFMVHNSVPAGNIRPVMAFPVIDRLLGLASTPWSERYRKDYLDSKTAAAKRKDSIAAAQVPDTRPSHALSDYAGKYTNAVYGEVTIELDGNGQLLFSFRGNQGSPLRHYHYDYFVTDEAGSGRPEFRLQFLTNPKGSIDRFSMQPYSDPAVEFVK